MSASRFCSYKIVSSVRAVESQHSRCRTIWIIYSTCKVWFEMYFDLSVTGWFHHSLPFVKTCLGSERNKIDCLYITGRWFKSSGCLCIFHFLFFVEVFGPFQDRISSRWTLRKRSPLTTICFWDITTLLVPGKLFRIFLSSKSKKWSSFWQFLSCLYWSVAIHLYIH